MTNSVFVFGSNREGRHGAGAALAARKYHGAVYGQARGLQGNSYAIVTKELRPAWHPVELTDIQRGVQQFIEFARSRPDLEFFVSPVGCGLAGFTADEIAPMFKGCPKNVQLCEEFQAAIRRMNSK